MGPLEMMYSAQSLLCAVSVIGLTKLVTAILDATMGVEKRKANKVLSSLVLPATTVAIGAIYGALVPFRPDVLTEYFADGTHGAWMYLAFAAWGGACGQFSQTLYDRVMDLVRAKK